MELRKLGPAREDVLLYAVSVCAVALALLRLIGLL
jgi:hypothetical protein